MKHLLDVSGLCKEYRVKGKVCVAVKDISFSINGGEVVAFLGPNGSGKTTTIKMILNLVKPTSGTVSLPEGGLAEVGAVLEGSRNIYWRLSVRENLEYFGRLRGVCGKLLRQKIDGITSFFKMNKYIDSPVRILSRGQQQKAAVAAALVHNPKLLLLDEPTLGLDIESTEDIIEKLHYLAIQEGKAIMFTTHQLDIVNKLGERVIMVKDGAILLDSSMTNLQSIVPRYVYSIVVKNDVKAGKPLGRIQQLSFDVEENSDLITIHFDTTSHEELYDLIKNLYPAEILKVENRMTDIRYIFRCIRFLDKDEACKI
ncbi:ABC transporter ATP-binding protein [Dehalococcoidia bacterium]|nr:ABC transporter ATP-binding protein [Dehalococcoidia bacterium]